MSAKPGHMPWFRMWTEWLDDPKVQTLSMADQRHHVALLCLKCKGYLPSSDDAAIALCLRINETEWKQTRETLMKHKLLFQCNSDETDIETWAKRQCVSDNSTARVKKHRAKKRTSSGTESSAVRHEDTSETPVKRFRNVSETVTVTPRARDQNRLEQIRADQNREEQNTEESVRGEDPSPGGVDSESPEIDFVRRDSESIQRADEGGDLHGGKPHSNPADDSPVAAAQPGQPGAEPKTQGKPPITAALISEVLGRWNVVAADHGYRRTKGQQPARELVRKRLRDPLFSKHWREAFERLREHGPHPHLAGDNDRGWTAGLSWALTRKALPKILDGEWDAPKPRQDPLTSADLELARLRRNTV